MPGYANLHACERLEVEGRGFSGPQNETENGYLLGGCHYMIRILIADDHPVVRSGLKHILADATGMKVVGEACDGREALAFVRKNACDVVVLDIAMPSMNGLYALKQLRAEKPKLPVLILSVYPEDQYAVRVLKSGASGYLMKDSAPEELVAAVNKVVSGGIYVSASLAERLAFNLRPAGDRPPHELLSDREFEVLRFIAAGKTVGEIGRTLFLSEKTISTYRARILEKMGMKTNAELMLYAVKHELVQ